MTTELQIDNRFHSVSHKQLCMQIRNSLQANGYFRPACQIQVSVTPNQTIQLSGDVDNFFLKQQAICSALKVIAPDVLEDNIQVNNKPNNSH